MVLTHPFATSNYSEIRHNEPQTIQMQLLSKHTRCHYCEPSAVFRVESTGAGRRLIQYLVKLDVLG